MFNLYKNNNTLKQRAQGEKKKKKGNIPTLDTSRAPVGS